MRRLKQVNATLVRIMCRKVDKIRYFAEHHPQLALEWHFIGPLQSNKTRLVAEHFDWVHTIDREKIALRLSEQRPVNMPPLQVLIQVNTSGEASKSGIEPQQLFTLAELISSAKPHLKRADVNS